MLRRILLLSALVTAGCAMFGAPEWVQRGVAICGPIRCRGVVSAVGHAGYSDTITNPALRRKAAASEARVALLKRIEETLKLPDTDPMHGPVAGSVQGAEIMERWIASDDTEYALAELNRMSMHLALQRQTNLTVQEREAFENRLSPLWEKLPTD